MPVVVPDAFSHVMLFTHDVAESAVFYETRLGFRRPSLASEHYAVLEHQTLDIRIALHHAKTGSVHIGHSPQLYFGVADIDEAVKALRLAGIDVTDPRSEGGPRFSMLRDNAGNIVGLQELP